MNGAVSSVSRERELFGLDPLFNRVVTQYRDRLILKAQATLRVPPIQAERPNILASPIVRLERL